jgi:hypothetical protein
VNHLVFLDARAGELEKVLSGVKTMLTKELDPAQSTTFPVRPGDRLYFLRDNGECAVRVRATVLRVLPAMDSLDQGLSHTLKEMQPRLQLTEGQYNRWSGKKQVLLVEFTAAQKIPVIYVASNRLSDRPDWIAFQEFSLIT